MAGGPPLYTSTKIVRLFAKNYKNTTNTLQFVFSLTFMRQTFLVHFATIFPD